MKKIFFFLTGVFVFDTGFSQVAPSIQWQNTIGGNNHDGLYCIQQTTDGGYILGGTSSSNISVDKTENTNGGNDYWVVKTDSAGNIQWQNTIGGSYWDNLYSIQQTAEGGYILGGLSNSNISGDKTENNWDTTLLNPTSDYWVIKLDPAGNIQWQNTIGGNNSDELYSIEQTIDGGYILGGYSLSNISGDKTENAIATFSFCCYDDYWIVKIDSIGNVQWQNTIGGDSTDHLTSIKQTFDGGYILGGWSISNTSGDKNENSLGNSDYWAVKLDPFGNIQWQNTIGGNYQEELHSIRQTFDGGFILAGSSISDISGDKTENCLGDIDYWVVKLDTSGNIQWQNTIGGNSGDELNSVEQTLDGGYILGGISYSNISGDKTENNIGGGDYWVIKIDSVGITQWQNTVGGNYGDGIRSISQTSDGGFLLGGTSWSNISGDKTENCIGLTDYWIIKLAPDTITSIHSAIPNPHSSISFSPNPANEYSVISYRFAVGDVLRITDILGRIIFTKTFSSPTLNSRLQTLNYLPGIYFVEVISDKGKTVRKMLKQ